MDDIHTHHAIINHQINRQILKHTHTHTHKHKHTHTIQSNRDLVTLCRPYQSSSCKKNHHHYIAYHHFLRERKFLKLQQSLQPHPPLHI